MNARTRNYITEQLLTTQELSVLIGVKEVTLKKRYERNPSLAVLKGKILLWARRDFERKRRHSAPLTAALAEKSPL